MPMKKQNTQQKLRAWRAKNKLSQSQAATRLGVPVRTLQEWEQARRTPRGLSAKALLEAIEIKSQIEDRKSSFPPDRDDAGDGFLAG